MPKNEPSAPGLKRRVAVTGGTKRRVDRSNLQQQLGATEVSRVQQAVDTPLGFVAVRRELIESRRSTGGRPGFADAERRKIPVADSVWRLVSDAAAEMAEPGFHPSPAQVASAILSVAVQRLGPDLKRDARQALKASRRVDIAALARSQAAHRLQRTSRRFHPATPAIGCFVSGGS